MIVSCNDIKTSLKNYFQIDFDVTFAEKTFILKPQNSEENLFVVRFEFKDDVRFIAECEPDKYGAAFVDSLSNAPKGKKEAFCACWNKLISTSKLNKVRVKINDVEVNPSTFITLALWKKINIRYTKIPYFDDEELKKENALNCIIDFMTLILSLVEYDVEGYEEGNSKYTIHKIYERNPLNRKLCLALKGYRCSVCGKLLEDEYGEIAKNFIEVHHATPVSMMGDHYNVDPVNDLFPVCPNCHTMLHKKNPPYSIEELKALMEEKKK